MSEDLRNRSILVALLVAAWAALAYSKGYVPASVTPDVNNIIAYIQVLLGGVVGYHVGAGSGPSAPPVAATPPSAQAGFARIGLLAVIACGTLLLAAGCTTTTASMYRGYMTDATAGIKTWDDNSIATIQAVLCAQPYSAIQRHPEIQAGIVAMCGPMANTASIDPAQVQLMLNVVKQLNAAPAAAK